MDSGAVVGLVAVVAILALVAGALIYAAVSGRVGKQAPSVAPAPPAPPPVAEPDRFRDRLRRLQQAKQWPDLFRVLDRSMPEWLVSASLIEVAREIAGLEEQLTRARHLGVSEEVTGRLATQADAVSTDLWSMAERIVVADQVGGQDLRESLEQHDEALIRLRGGIREAREGLAALSLGDVAGTNDLRLAEGRFRSLAATARELQEWERASVPW